MSKHNRNRWKSTQTERRLHAEVIAAERAKRSPEDQLALIKTRPGTSAKETARLLKTIEDRKRAPAKRKQERKKAQRRKSKA